jgi:predicted RNase H-like HicB family nuclease
MAERTFTAFLHQEGAIYVAECPEIGTVSQGLSAPEAVANLKEATLLYLEECPLAHAQMYLVADDPFIYSKQSFVVP